ncbi:hypothetical protein [Chromobacterium amazonense]|uniref:hypothetical protein n=1 Tax=Chromobacterium amazonense TaxID=1382803 RepID=UPI0031F6ED45
MPALRWLGSEPFPAERDPTPGIARQRDNTLARNCSYSISLSWPLSLRWVSAASSACTLSDFGREEPEFSWERTDKVEALRADAGLAQRSEEAEAVFAG